MKIHPRICVSSLTMKIVSLVKPSVITLNHPKHLDLLNSNYQSLEMPNNKGNEVKGNVEKIKKNN